MPDQDAKSEAFYSIAINAPLWSPLTYRGPTTEEPPLFSPGQSVFVPLGKRKKVEGVIVEVLKTTKKELNIEYEIKNIISPIEDRPVLDSKMRQWLDWLSDYYVHPKGQVYSLAFPPLQKKKAKKDGSRLHEQKKNLQKPPPLTPEQEKCFSALKKHVKFSVHLLFGVTGSGKTEIYLHWLEEILARGQTGLMLVPEIALTPQLVHRFNARFGENVVAVIHSQLTERNKTNQWWDIASGQKKILIGTRSALFCPIPQLGLIIVDEEHEASYKQEEKLRYNARDSAIMRAKIEDVPILLGSATPSLESWQNALSKKYFLHEMPSRVSARKPPRIEIINRRKLKNLENTQSASYTVTTDALSNENDKVLPFWMSRELFEATRETLEKKQQAAFFLNRRGVAQTVFCRCCGFSYRCPNCEITLTLHGKKDLVCHYCDYVIQKENSCPQCHEPELADLGLGTEQVEADIKRLFPQARLARADRDEINNRETLENLIHQMESRETDILIGTQMIAKGLDFPHLTLVGLVLADIGFNRPDFRSVERSFQLLTQVSGRSGRHFDEGGRVLIQTYNPDYPALRFVPQADYKSFAQAELEERKALHYPPFGRLASLRVLSPNMITAETTAELIGDRAFQLKLTSAQYASIQVLGPAPSPLFKIRNSYRYHLLLKGPLGLTLSHFCRQLLGDSKWIPAQTKVQIDIDPVHLL